MQVTTVSPSPASPTEGDDLCETDVTDVAIHSVTLLICLCGLAGNGAVIGLLNLKSVNYGIFDLALADFLFLLFTVPSAILFLVEDGSCSPIVPMLYLRFLLQLSVVSYYWGLFRLTAHSLGKDVASLCKLCCCCQLPERLIWVVWRAKYWVFFALFTIIPAVTYLCPSQEQEHCQAAVISMYTIILLLFVAPVVIYRTIVLIKAKQRSQQQQPRRRNIVIIIIVLFTLLLIMCNFLQEVGYITVPSQVVFLLTCIHSTIKPFIYFLAGRCRRPCSVQSLQLTLNSVFEEQKEKTACGNDAPSLLIHSCSAEGPQESGRGFP
ncbi:mas-related G-protein coupled receptor member H-like [Zonotrichia leucophrys gambelii]|uniref:mas-related G-protein coupled receptor member H-like n=1 Tax=Zonotrichia leucophrys gambelii TaxID=257770 RepID=UPI00313FF031